MTLRENDVITGELLEGFSNDIEFFHPFCFIIKDKGY
jgi:hypothetical protein